MIKSARTVWTEGSLYVIIAAGSPIAEFLVSDRVISDRSLCAVAVIAIVAGANALKAFLSQSIASSEKNLDRNKNSSDSPES